ncbi:MAG: Ca-activated chloride channel family protein, partial [Planctomycetota bacterium]
MRFESPYWFAALAVLAVGILVRFIYKQAGLRSRPAILFSNMPPLMNQAPTLRMRLKKAFGLIRILALTAIIVALARPQIGRADTVVTSNGIDILLAVDTSGSMRGEDFGGNKTRLEHVAEVMKDFAAGRKADRIGIVSFGKYAYTRCPLTLDNELVADFLEKIVDDWLEANDSALRKQAGLIRTPLSPREEDLGGTAIGDGLMTAVGRLEESDAKSKVVILLSDGEQTAGDATPQDAAALAKKFNVKVYAVGAGSDQGCVITAYNRLGRRVKVRERYRVDEETLKEIAKITEGQYFHASDRAGLEAVYKTIDDL